MKRFLEEYGFVILIVICIGGLVATALIIKVRNDRMVMNNFSDFTNTSQTDLGGQGLGDGDSGTDKGEGYAIPDANKDGGEIKTPDVMW